MSLLQRLRERFWFIPAVLCLGAFALAEALIALDEHLGDLELPPWAAAVLYRVGESGSRDLLGAIAGSSLAVAGTTFSITMAVLALTSSTYGPRLVRNFMADRGNQAVLGVFVATFLYALLVLRSIRVIGDGDEDAFVPHLAVNVAVVLAVVDVAVLIYFIHHISDSIQIATLTAGVRQDLRATVERLYPRRGTPDPDGADGDPWTPPDDGAPVLARRSGYVQFTDEDDLVELGARRDVVVSLSVRPGRYVLEGAVVARVHPGGRADDDTLDSVRTCIHLADARTPYQDPEFAVQQLTETAVRALSPGINDPYTAVNALDDLSSGLSLLAARAPQPRGRTDGDGTLRVRSPRVEAGELVTAVLDAMRWYASGAPSVMYATVALVERVAAATSSASLRGTLHAQLGLLQDAFAAAGHHDHDVRLFADRVAAARSGLLG